MSGLINKVKEKIAEVKADSNTHSSTNAGPHNSNVANTADPRVDSDLSGGHPGSNTAYTGTGSTGTSGIGSSGANTTYSGGNTTAGPHSSNMANKLDPRVDSDLSGGHPGSNTGYTTTGATGTTGTTGTTGFGSSNYSGTTTGSTGYGSNTGSTGYGANTGTTNTAGPHNSDMLNKLDPRVDSDLSGGHPGSNATFTHTGTTGATGTTGTTGGYSSTAGGLQQDSTNAGLNQTTHAGHHGHHHGHHGHHGGSTNAGPHNSNLMNSADPRVDSDLSGSRNAGFNQTTDTYGSTGQSGFGGATTTTNTTSTGPVHNSNLLNKLDPRVDSNADGSRNAGMAQTSTTQNVGSTQTGRLNEPLDAAKHRPSDFAAVHGDPTVQHDYPEHSSHARHGSVSKNDQHYGSGAL